jgi:sarcosine oxidase
MKSYDVIVVGVGSMGSAAIYHLAKRGARVLGLEQFDFPNALGASVGTNRIIRLAYAEHPDYVPLLHRAYALWRELEALAGETLLIITGGLDIGTSQSEIVRGSLRACAEHRLDHEVLNADAIGRRFPAYRLPTEMVGVYQPQGGFVMSERCVAAYALAAMDEGAEVHGRERVTNFEVRAGRVHVTSDFGEYEARRLVLCAGPWTSRLLPRFSRLVEAERQVLLWTQPKRADLFRHDRFPIFNMDSGNGRFYGFPVYAVPGFKIGKYHHRREPADAESLERNCDQRDETILREGIRRFFPDADGPTLAMKACMFTNSPDEHFLIDRHPELPEVVIAAGFSGHGFKFSSVIGEILADLSVDGETRWNINLFRLDRPEIASFR